MIVGNLGFSGASRWSPSESFLVGEFLTGLTPRGLLSIALVQNTGQVTPSSRW